MIDLRVYFEGEAVLTLSENLLNKQDCWDNVGTLKDLHAQRLKIEQMMDKMPEYAVKLEKKWTEVQFKLQDAWGFDRNAKFHKFWEIPSCECPVLDNEDAYPTGYYLFNSHCPIHGDSK